MALASDSIHYTPPPAARNVAQRGEIFPLWLADTSDYVVLGEDGRRWREKMIHHGYAMAKPWDGQPVDGCVPWGWSKAVRTVFLNLGVAPSVLPDDAYLNKIRMLSHRRLTVEAQKKLGYCDVPVEAFSLEECDNALDRWSRVIGKYPWSSTGRGLFSGTPEHRESYRRRCAGALNHQGSVMIEPAYDVVLDFAMLFYGSEQGSIDFRGLSLFKTNNRAYIENVLLDDASIVKELLKYIASADIENVKHILLLFLNEKLGGFYKGWMGVDMLVYRDSAGSYGLNPCVEINLRHTMGAVAHEKVRKLSLSESTPLDFSYGLPE